MPDLDEECAVNVELVVQQMRLDRLAVRASSCLRQAGVPHALLKGPTTANWLYSPPRPYNDVDMLVPLSRVQRAAAALSAASVAEASAGRLGEEASHSLLMRTKEGMELDLHVTLPMLPPSFDTRRADVVWNQLEPHVEDFALDGVQIPALDEVARCLVLALHALGNGPHDPRSMEDLRRARSVSDEGTWAEARRLGQQLGAPALLPAALTLVEGGPLPRGLPVDARLRLQWQDGGAAFQLERFASAPRRELPRLLLRELVPSVGFMRYSDPSGTRTRRGLLLAYVRRWRRLSVSMPQQLRQWSAARRT